MKNNSILKNSILALIALSATQLSASTYLRDSSIDEADWATLTTWVDADTKQPVSTLPSASDNVRLWYNTTNVSTSGNLANNVSIQEDTVGNLPKLNITTGGELTISQSLYLKNGEINQSGGSLTVKGISYFNAGHVDISGGTFNFNNLQTGDNAETSEELVIFIHGDAKLKDNGNSGLQFGTNAKNRDMTVNISDSAEVNGRMRIGVSDLNKESTSTAQVVVNVSLDASITSDYLNFYRNARLDLSGDSKYTVSGQVRLGDMSSKTNATAAMLYMSDNASLTTTGTNEFVLFRGSVLRMTDNSKLEIKNNKALVLGRTWDGDTSTSATVILRDTATLTSGNIILHNDSLLEVHGSKVTVKSYALGQTGGVNQTGKVRFVADADGISTLNFEHLTYADATEQVSYALILDFSDLVLTPGETKLMDIFSVSNSDSGRRETIIANYIAKADKLISVIKANSADTYELIAGTKTLSISYTAVPEPATYAAILGALAVAFAFYRRRK